MYSHPHLLPGAQADWGARVGRFAVQEPVPGSIARDIINGDPRREQECGAMKIGDVLQCYFQLPRDSISARALGEAPRGPSPGQRQTMQRLVNAMGYVYSAKKPAPEILQKAVDYIRENGRAVLAEAEKVAGAARQQFQRRIEALQEDSGAMARAVGDMEGIRHRGMPVDEEQLCALLETRQRFFRGMEAGLAHAAGKFDEIITGRRHGLPSVN